MSTKTESKYTPKLLILHIVLNMLCMLATTPPTEMIPLVLLVSISCPLLLYIVFKCKGDGKGKFAIRMLLFIITITQSILIENFTFEPLKTFVYMYTTLLIISIVYDTYKFDLF